MKGTVTKRDFIAIIRAFGLWKALQVLVSRQPAALLILMK